MTEVSGRARVLRPEVGGVRWRRGERLEQLFERQCDRAPDRLAVDTAGGPVTYRQLDARANRLARHLLANGVRPGDRVGLLFDESVHGYAGMLAVLKANAAYVPLDVAFPDDRIAYIARDAGIRVVLTLSHLTHRLRAADVEPLCVDEARLPLADAGGQRLTAAERGEPADQLCYIVYTSGSTGRPKGVAVEHASICNFVRVAAEVYGIEPADRVYQGMTIAFDFSVEEIWVPWLSGATLVPKPGATSLVGHELGDFLRDNGVTALCCVPTLLATLDEDLPGLRFLLVSGEACPRDLVARWHRPGRRFLNVYGPTEATVTATWTTVDPERPVTIGVPLPTYAVAILDPEADRALGPGEIGEIGIAGIGLARGYLNRDDLTDRVFVRDFLGIADNPSGRIYRTGDLGRVNDDGHIEYLGRIDTQVKIRGYRVELTEIESVLLRVPGIAQAVVDTYEPEPGTVELVGYYSPRGAAEPDRATILAHLHERLPGYMVPAYLERLDAIPMTSSDKADRKRLPPPSGPRRLAARDHVEPATETERVLAEVLAGVLHVPRVGVDSDFFADLGANSLLMSRFCARAREHPELPPISMREVYRSPSVRALAAALPEAPVISTRTAEDTVEPLATWRYLLCGALQALIFLAYLYFYALIADVGIDWILSTGSLLDAYLRSVAFGGAGFLAVCAVPVAAKWLLVGRWRERSFPVWSLAYVRFWTVASLIRFNPMRMFVGSPLYVAYLRLLGARIGRGAVILSQHVPVCTDLLSVGAGSVIRKDSLFTGYRAVAGRIHTGPVTLGREVFVGEATTLEIGSSMGERSQLGHSSCLHSGTSVPDGESWHGSPAVRSTVDYRAGCSARLRPWRRITFSASQLLTMVAVTIPAALLTGTLLDKWLTGGQAIDESSPLFYETELGYTCALYFGAVAVGLALVFTLPRLLALFVRPDRDYPLYGPRYSMQRAVTRFTNSRTFTYLFGDSSYIVHYLRLLGYDLGEVEQTGSNFGVEVRHESPFAVAVGAGTMVSDGLSLLNVDYSSTAFRVRRASVGRRNFLGNDIVYPPGGRTGDNCLLATKVMIPLDGEIRSDTGLLGSPCFPIPRSVDRDLEFDHLRAGPGFRRLLAAKNRHNTVTLALFMLSRWGDVFGVAVINLVALDLYRRFGTPATAAGLLASYLFVVGYGVLVERASQGFRTLRPRFCSIYDRAFWRHERFWKLSAGRYLALFNGTPFKSLLWRLLGVHIGHRVFDDGCGIPEKTLVTIGDDAVLNIGSVIQCHSLEDGAFKSDHTTIGAGCTIGVAAFVHYGVTMGDHSVLDADAFLMKGGEPAPRTRWRGNPATELPSSN
jgi:non-ribosomal peptide synthetase-like protein